MVNWDRLNQSLRRFSRALPLCGVLLMIAAVVLAVFRRDVWMALEGVFMGLTVLGIGLRVDACPAPGPVPAPPPVPTPAPAPDRTPESARPLYCPHCGAQRLENGQKFCMSCGKPLA